MIIRRENYQELNWWQWAHLRLLMGWGRVSGQFRRGIGVEESKQWQAQLASQAAESATEKCPFCGATGHKSFKSH